MTKSITDNRKKKRVGRPRVDALLIGVRVPPSGVTEIDNWIKKNEPGLSRPEAIRQLVEAGLKPHAFCLSDEKAAEIGAWAKANGLSLHEAISSLVEIGLRAAAKKA